jgi:two-component system response regulator YesN
VGITIRMQDGFERLSDVPEKYRQVLLELSSEAQISPVAKRAKQYISENYSNSELTLETVANEIFVTPVYLSRLIKQELGTTFVGLITQLRTQKAVQLLNTTDLSILEISDQCGYDSQHYFSTAFKKMMGVSPNQYRRGVNSGN